MRRCRFIPLTKRERGRTVRSHWRRDALARMAIGGGAMEGQILRAPPWTAAHVGAAVAAVYSRVGTSPAETFRFPVGPALAHQLGYPEDFLQSLPPTTIESYTGVACPSQLRTRSTVRGG